MQPLVDYLDKHQDTPLPALMKLDNAEAIQDDRGRLDRRRLWEVLAKEPDHRIMLEGVGAVRRLDLLAADSYRRLRDHHH